MVTRGTQATRRGSAALIVLAGLVWGLVPADAASSRVARAGPAACGTEPPPEVTAEPDGWALPNRDLANSRQAGSSRISSATIKRLGVAWSYDVPGKALFGNLTTGPIVTGGRVFVGALDGSIHAVDLGDGSADWSVRRGINVFGPAGVAVGWGQVYGIAAEATVVAHDSATGKVAWTRSLKVAPGNQVDMAPNLVGGCVLVSTQALAPGSRGTLYALDHTDGRIVWQFETVPDDFWGNKKVNHGGGAWYPPAVDEATGRSYWGTSNPWPSPGDTGFPAGASRPGDNLYTDSAVAIEADGTLAWFHQVFQHDIWDRDMVLTQLVDLPGGGKVVVHTGKGARVLAYDPDTGEVRWDIPVGRHQNDDLTTFDKPTTVLPGVLGGVETPPASADGKVYVSVVNAPTTHDSPEERFSLEPQLGTYPSNLIAIDAATGHIDWQVDLPGDSLGGVTVVNDLLLTSTFDGTLLAYDRSTGAEVWRYDAGGMVNGWPSVVGDTIVWPISGGKVSHLLALRLDAVGPTPSTTTSTTSAPPLVVTPPAARPVSGRPTFTG